jgi:NADPH-dependent 2,4-dienoyl-CoA reductase/sulfur reductase-like enzyme
MQPSMFGVPKYSKALASLAVERSVSTHFSHNLLSLSHLNKTATFSTPEGSPTPTITKEFDFLHVVPPQGPLDAVKSSPLADADGWVAVDRSSLQHEKYKNVFALGDCSSLPTGKTAAAVTSQTPVLVENLQALMNGREGKAVYDGYSEHLPLSLLHCFSRALPSSSCLGSLAPRPDP